MYLKSGRKVPRRSAVVRDVDKAILATVSNSYHVLQNSEAFGVLDLACREFGVTIETAGALGKGDRVWMLAKLPESIEPVKGDKVNGYCLIVTGHNGWTPYSARLTAIRVVCNNTLTAALASGKAAIRLVHKRTDLEQMDLVANMVTELVTGLKETNRTYQRLAAKKVTASDVDAYVSAVLNLELDAELTGVAARKKQSMIDMVTTSPGSEFAPGTAWAAYNGITAFIDHCRTAKADRVLRQADQSAVFGPNARMKAKALRLALAL